MDFTKPELEAVLFAASRDGSRFNLNGVLVEKARIVATDGHRLHMIDAGEDVLPSEVPSKPVILARTDLVDLQRSIKNGDRVTMKPDPEVRGSELVRVLVADGKHSDVAVIDGEYPKYRDVLKSTDGKPVATITINAHYLKDACMAVIKAGGHRGSAMKLEVFDELSPIRITAGPVTCVLMPMRA